MTTCYPVETLGEDEDDGTIVGNVARLAESVVGRRIVRVDRRMDSRTDIEPVTIITLNDGTRVNLADTHDCCASTAVNKFLLYPDRVDHIITGVGTTGRYSVWHIVADLGDVLQLDVDWSCGNPFYYSYGFVITVDAPPAS